MTDFMTDFIEAQEKNGQQILLSTSLLPKDNDINWEYLKSWGVQKGADKDDLLCYATLPPGWSKKPSEYNPLWTHLVDDRGLTRAKIFYKAAFYDRDAILRVIRHRFEVRDVSNSGARYAVVDQGREVAVKRFETAYYGVLKEDAAKVGIIWHDRFYFSESEESDWIDMPAESATQISDEEFYEKCHTNSFRWHVADKAKELASAEAKEFIRSLPSDNSQWSAEFDFPEQQA